MFSLFSDKNPFCESSKLIIMHCIFLVCRSRSCGTNSPWWSLFVCRSRSCGTNSPWWSLFGLIIYGLTPHSYLGRRNFTGTSYKDMARVWQPDSHKVSAFMSSRFRLQTCKQGTSWKYVNPDQRQWYWDEFVKNYRWDDKDDQEIRAIWHKNSADIYRRTLHAWRKSGKKPDTVDDATWATWQAVWASGKWQARSEKYKANRNSEPAGEGTGVVKHIAGSKSFAGHVVQLREELSREPTSWETFIKVHRRPNGTFVDERSRQINEEMERRLEQPVAQFDEDLTQDPPFSAEHINSIFLDIVGGVQRQRVYGIGSVARTIYPEVMTPKPRGPNALAAAREEARVAREEAWVATQQAAEARVKADEIELAMATASQRHDATQMEFEAMRSRIASLEETVQLFITGTAGGALIPHGSQDSRSPWHASGSQHIPAHSGADPSQSAGFMDDRNWGHSGVASGIDHLQNEHGDAHCSNDNET